jgi:hypothetical protein
MVEKNVLSPHVSNQELALIKFQIEFVGVANNHSCFTLIK